MGTQDKLPKQQLHGLVLGKRIVLFCISFCVDLKRVNIQNNSCTFEKGNATIPSVTSEYISASRKSYKKGFVAQLIFFFCSWPCDND